MSVTQKLAAWAAETPDIQDQGAVDKARDAVLDTIGVMIAGAPDQAAKRVRRAVALWGNGPATVVGQTEKLAAPWAALANGTAAHVLDFDDSFSPVSGHSSAVMVPALLALAEAEGVTGHAILDAYVVGLEIQARIGQAVNVEHYKLGWHSTSTVATIGSAAGCARLLGLNVDGMRNAISIAVSTAAGSKRQFGTMAKPMHAGLAAKNAVMAASLAAAGIEASEEPLDGMWGFRELYAGDASPGFELAMETLGNPLAIEEFQLNVKVYPCCASTHTSLDGLLALKAKNGFSADDVDLIKTTVPPINFNNLMYADPKSEMEKRFSMQYCLSTAVRNGEVVVSDFQPGGDMPNAVRNFMSKVEMIKDNKPDANPAHPTHIEIKLRDGRTLTTEVDKQKGTKAFPLKDADYERKFLGCAATGLDQALAVDLHRAIMHLDEQVSIKQVMAPLRGLRGAAVTAE